MSKFRTVDADGHVEEAHVNWVDRIAEPYETWRPNRVRRPIAIGAL
ncbi:MAG TPA: hypothetical protein VF089_09865 [Candidatus Binatia bacterium]